MDYQNIFRLIFCWWISQWMDLFELLFYLKAETKKELMLWILSYSIILTVTVDVQFLTDCQCVLVLSLRQTVNVSWSSAWDRQAVGLSVGQQLSDSRSDPEDQDSLRFLLYYSCEEQKEDLSCFCSDTNVWLGSSDRNTLKHLIIL